jgi:HAD superfamily hydrolase (TIGR01509 family)
LKQIIFDMDGVIVDSHPIHKLAWRRLLEMLGKQVSDEELDFILDGRKREEILRHFLGDLTEDQLQSYGALKDELLKDMAAEIKPVPGLIEFLDLLERAGIPKAIATCAHTSRVRWMLGQLKLLDRFSAIITGEDIVDGKPDPAIFNVAAARLRSDPENVLVIEDAVSGVKAAKHAGMRCLAIATPPRAKLLREAGADEVVPDFRVLSLSKLEALFP